MKALKGVVGGLAAAAALGAQLASPASASVVPVLKWGEISATCGGDHYTALMVPGTAVFTPVFLTDTNKTLVPYQVRYNVSGAGGLKTRHDVNYLLGETVTKAAPMPADSVTCDLSGGFDYDNQSYSFTGTVTGPLR
ncbi:MAG: hypothetical protein QOK15_106 [Nocardioidaceae bacterium]|nr:hypothetical protein [Nocardioidaceae bacterium]